MNAKFKDNKTILISNLSKSEDILVTNLINKTTIFSSTLYKDEYLQNILKLTGKTNISYDKLVSLDLSSGNQEVLPDEGLLFSKVEIEKPSTLTPDNIKQGINIAGIFGNIVPLNGSDITIIPSKESQDITPSGDSNAFTSIHVEPINVKLQDIEITENGVYKVPDGFDGFGTIIVNVKGSSSVPTQEQIDALNNMKTSIDNQDLIIEYDNEVLDLDFNIQNNDLIVDNNVRGTEFEINNNGELEVIY